MRAAFDRRSGKALQLALLGAAPAHGAVAQDLRGHLGQPGREFGLELSVLLVERGSFTRQRQRLAAESGEVLVFCDLGVINDPLTPYPLPQAGGLGRRGVERKPHAGRVFGH